MPTIDQMTDEQRRAMFAKEAAGGGVPRIKAGSPGSVYTPPKAPTVAVAKAMRIARTATPDEARQKAKELAATMTPAQLAKGSGKGSAAKLATLPKGITTGNKYMDAALAEDARLMAYQPRNEAERIRQETLHRINLLNMGRDMSEDDPTHGDPRISDADRQLMKREPKNGTEAARQARIRAMLKVEERYAHAKKLRWDGSPTSGLDTSTFAGALGDNFLSNDPFYGVQAISRTINGIAALGAARGISKASGTELGDYAMKLGERAAAATFWFTAAKAIAKYRADNPQFDPQTTDHYLAMAETIAEYRGAANVIPTLGATVKMVAPGTAGAAAAKLAKAGEKLTAAKDKLAAATPAGVKNLAGKAGAVHAKLSEWTQTEWPAIIKLGKEINAAPSTLAAWKAVAKVGIVVGGAASINAFEQAQVARYKKEYRAALEAGKPWKLAADYDYRDADPYAHVAAAVGIAAIGSTGNPLEKQFRNAFNGAYSLALAKRAVYAVKHDLIAEAEAAGRLTKAEAEAMRADLAEYKPGATGKAVYTFQPASVGLVKYYGSKAAEYAADGRPSLAAVAEVMAELGEDRRTPSQKAADEAGATGGEALKTVSNVAGSLLVTTGKGGGFHAMAAPNRAAWRAEQRAEYRAAARAELADPQTQRRASQLGSQASAAVLRAGGTGNAAAAAFAKAEKAELRRAAKEAGKLARADWTKANPFDDRWNAGSAVAQGWNAAMSILGVLNYEYTGNANTGKTYMPTLDPRLNPKGRQAVKDAAYQRQRDRPRGKYGEAAREEERKWNEAAAGPKPPAS